MLNWKYDGFSWVRVRGEVSRRRRQLVRAIAMDAGAAAIEAGRDLAGDFAGDEESAREDQAKIDNFQRRLREHGLAGRYCLLYQKPASDAHDLDGMRCIGLSKSKLLERLAGPNTLLNLSYSIHPPFLRQFERRFFAISIRAKLFIG